MIVYRITRKQFAKDLSGEGARRYGGRWNKKGVPMLYTSTSVSLAVLETLAHLPKYLLPKNMALVCLHAEGKPKGEELQTEELPKNWRQLPLSVSTQKIGSEWVASKNSLFLKVPSVLIPQEKNVLFNILHPDFRRIEILSVEDFVFDERLGIQ